LISLHGLIVMIGLAIYVAVSRTLRQRRHPSAAIAWVVTLLQQAGRPRVTFMIICDIGRTHLAFGSH